MMFVLRVIHTSNLMNEHQVEAIYRSLKDKHEAAKIKHIATCGIKSWKRLYVIYVGKYNKRTVISYIKRGEEKYKRWLTILDPKYIEKLNDLGSQPMRFTNKALMYYLGLSKPKRKKAA